MFRPHRRLSVNRKFVTVMDGENRVLKITGNCGIDEKVGDIVGNEGAIGD